MSPKINKSGVSYDENDPRAEQVTLPEGSAVVCVERAQDMDAAREGLPSADELAQAREAAAEQADADEQWPGPDDEEHDVTGDGDQDGAQISAVADYSSWTKAQLNEELDGRGIAHDSRATNEALVELLEADDKSNPRDGSDG